MNNTFYALRILVFLTAVQLGVVSCGGGGSATVVNEGFGIGDHKFSLVHDGLTRTYQVHVPPSYNKEIPTPIVIYIHGGGGNASAAYSDGIDAYADKHGFVLAIPEGTGSVDGVGNLQAVWNGGKWVTGECCGTADDVGFISAMIEKLKLDFSVDSKMIYATGISNGGLMTNRLGCQLSDKIAAIATVAPAAVMSNCNPARAVPYMQIHGREDACNDYDTGEATFSTCKNVPYTRMSAGTVVDTWRTINSCPSLAVQGYQKNDASCVTYDNCRNGSAVEFCTVNAMGHTWPSGAQYLPASMIGPVNFNISTDQIWAFFKRHSL